MNTQLEETTLKNDKTRDLVTVLNKDVIKFENKQKEAVQTIKATIETQQADFTHYKEVEMPAIHEEVREEAVANTITRVN